MFAVALRKQACSLCRGGGGCCYCLTLPPAATTPLRRKPEEGSFKPGTRPGKQPGGDPSHKRHGGDEENPIAPPRSGKDI